MSLDELLDLAFWAWGKSARVWDGSDGFIRVGYYADGGAAITRGKGDTPDEAWDAAESNLSPIGRKAWEA